MALLYLEALQRDVAETKKRNSALKTENKKLREALHYAVNLQCLSDEERKMLEGLYE